MEGQISWYDTKKWWDYSELGWSEPELHEAGRREWELDEIGSDAIGSAQRVYREIQANGRPARQFSKVSRGVKDLARQE